MQQLSSNGINNKIIPSYLNERMNNSLVHYVYSHTTIAIVASLFCATVVLIGLYQSADHYILWGWYFYCILVSIFRIILTRIYHQQHPVAHDNFWKNLFILSASFGALMWGLIGILLFPSSAPLQKMLCILILAGVTAGAMPALSAVLPAVMLFLVIAIVPFIIVIILIKKILVTALFDITLVAYLIYLIIIAITLHRQIKSVMYLQFENDQLLQKVSDTNRQLQEIATHDQLTGSANRRLFYIDLQNAINRAKRNDKLLGLFYVDIDHFKSVNDRYGHAVGDRLLQLVTQRLRNILREVDIIYRMGGDEFILILEEGSEQEAFKTLAVKICHALATPFKINDLIINVSASVGISIYPLDGQDENTLMTVADEAMYYVKSHGRNNFQFNLKRESQKKDL